MQKVPTAPGERKRRIVTEEERQQLHDADSLVELALKNDTRAGKKGAFGGLGQDARVLLRKGQLNRHTRYMYRPATTCTTRVLLCSSASAGLGG